MRALGRDPEHLKGPAAGVMHPIYPMSQHYRMTILRRGLATGAAPLQATHLSAAS